MGKILIYTFFFISFVYLLRKQKQFIFFLPVFSVVADMSFSFFLGFSAPTLIRAAITTIFFLFTLREIKKVNLWTTFLLFFFYISLILVFSTEFAHSLKAVVQIILSMSMFFVGYALIDSWNKYQRLILSLYWVIVIATISSALGYLFGIGRPLEYTLNPNYNDEVEIVGLLGSGGLYAPATALALLPLILQQKMSVYKKWGLYVSSILLFVFILLNVRRAIILIPIVGYLTLFAYSKTKGKVTKFIVAALIGVIITFPLYSDLLTKRIGLRERQGRLQADFYETEPRYFENLELIGKIKQFEDPAKVIFGLGNNIFAENIENGASVRRMYHSDSAKLLYGVGIFGLCIYILIYIVLIKQILKIPAIGVLKEIKAYAFSLIFISMFVSLNGSITLMSFRTFIFLYLGTLLGLAHRIIKSEGMILPKSARDKFQTKQELIKT